MSNVNSSLETLFSKMEHFITTKTVVGEPIHVGETIILPLVDVCFGVGAGSGNGNEKEGGAVGKGGGGGGLGAKIMPSAVLVIQNGDVQLVNVKDRDSLNKLIDMAPGIISKISDFCKKNKDKNAREDCAAANEEQDTEL